jgi:hypothetical protein
MSEQNYMAVEDAAAQLGVTRPTLYYYTKKLNIKTEKFPLDKHTYIATTDFERIKMLKEQAAKREAQRKGVSTEEAA